LPQREALNIARQIARALDFAHERGIVHRDLKPANIKITADGAVKVLDFGLAKAAAADHDDAGLGSASVPLRADGTVDGAILGTPAYMSPEQAHGQAVDKRTDIWAFGCVFYEMLTGRTAFEAGTVAETIARVVDRDPDWTLLPPATPERIRNLLLGCLAKDPRDRLRDIGDVRITIDSILSGSTPPGTVVPVSPHRRRAPAWIPWTLVAALAAALGWSLWSLPPLPSPPVTQWQIPLAGQTLDGSGGAHVLTLSDDGTQLAYVASPRLLYIRPINRNDPEAKPVPGTEKYKGVRDVEYSPDGREIAFYSFADQALKRLSVDGGQESTICEASTPTGIDWGPDGVVLFGQGRAGIWRASVNTTTATPIAEVAVGEEAHGPRFLPDGDHYLFTIATGRGFDRWDKARIVVQSLSGQGKDRVTLPINGSDARYVATGHLLYSVSGSIMAVRFDPDSRKVLGTARNVLEGVSRAAGSVTGAANFSVSADGTLAYVPGPPDATQPRMDLFLFDRTGKVKPHRLDTPPDRHEAMRASPDERFVAFGIEDEKDSAIYTLAVDGRTSRQRLTPAGTSAMYPEWTPDSTRIAYQSTRGADAGIWWQAAHGPDDASRLTTAADEEEHVPESWFGNTLLFSKTKDGMTSLWTLQMTAGKPGLPKRFGRATSTHPMSATISPNGRLVAYTKTERGETTVCVESFPTEGSYKCLDQKNADSAKHPRWSPDGTQLYFDPRRGDFESVPVETSPALAFGTPQRLEYHPFRLTPPGSRTPYDVTRRSGRYLGAIPVGMDRYSPPIPNVIRVTLNWVEILKERLPR